MLNLEKHMDESIARDWKKLAISLCTRDGCPSKLIFGMRLVRPAFSRATQCHILHGHGVF